MIDDEIFNDSHVLADTDERTDTILNTVALSAKTGEREGVLTWCYYLKQMHTGAPQGIQRYMVFQVAKSGRRFDFCFFFLFFF